MKLGASIVVAFLVCWLYLAAAVRDLDRNSALIGYREVTLERIVIKTSYGEVRFNCGAVSSHPLSKWQRRA